MSIILKNSIFIHIPKTGGMWVTQALKNSVGSYQRSYEPLYDEELNRFGQHVLPERIPDELKKGKKLFAFVRNPQTWYQSVFAYRTRSNWCNKEKSIVSRLCNAPHFNTFVLKCLAVFDPGYYTEMYSGFVDKVDYILKYENLADELVRILKELGEDFDEQKLRETPPINVASKSLEFKGRCDWDDEVYYLMRKKEKYMIERLGY